MTGQCTTRASAPRATVRGDGRSIVATASHGKKQRENYGNLGQSHGPGPHLRRSPKLPESPAECNRWQTLVSARNEVGHIGAETRVHQPCVRCRLIDLDLSVETKATCLPQPPSAHNPRATRRQDKNRIFATHSTKVWRESHRVRILDFIDIHLTELCSSDVYMASCSGA